MKNDIKEEYFVICYGQPSTKDTNDTVAVWGPMTRREFYKEYFDLAAESGDDDLLSWAVYSGPIVLMKPNLKRESFDAIPLW